jgi:hypothetical protein
MTTFQSNSAYTRYIGRELLQILITHGLNLNYELPSQHCSLLLAALKQSYTDLFTFLIDPITSAAGLDPNQ